MNVTRICEKCGTEYTVDSKDTTNLCHECYCEENTIKTKELRFFLVNPAETELNPNTITDEEFIELAEKQGTVYSTKGFQLAFNNEEIDEWGCYLRILEVEV